ncbi:hypothetical protein ZWY2020_005909 [Hordeum vulgare]|nr:hypothetical protein ZWY2020_005909 [Hordeum vulgare]
MDTSTRAAKIPSLPQQTEINWDNSMVGAGMFSCVTVALYPVSVIKTRMQVASGEAMRRNALVTFKNILKVDGCLVSTEGLGPAEKTKATSLKLVEPLQLSESMEAALANGLGGLTASLCSQAVFVPIDVVSQKLMVQGYSGHVRYKGGIDVVQKIMKADGPRGLYRGFGLSVMTYAPSSAVWWASYGFSQRVIWSALGRLNDKEDTPSQLKIVGVQVNINKPKASEVVRRLIAEDGWKGFYRGLGPRFFSSSAWGTSMIVCYEYLKRVCAKVEEA